MVVYSDKGNTLNQIDVLNITPSKSDIFKDMGGDKVFSFIGIKKIQDKEYYMIAPITHYAVSYKETTGNFVGINAKEVFIQRRAIDVDKATFYYLLSKELVYGKDIEENINMYPVCENGNYDDSVFIVLNKIKTKDISIVYFAKADGTLCSLLEYDFIEALNNGYTAPFTSVRRTQSSKYISCNSNRIYVCETTDDYKKMKELNYLSLIWYNGCLAVKSVKKTFPEGIEELECFIKAMERYENTDNIYTIVAGLGRGVYIDRDIYSAWDNRWILFLKGFSHINTKIYALFKGLIYSNYLTYRTIENGEPVDMSLRLKRLPNEKDIDYGDYWHSYDKDRDFLHFFMKDGRYLCFRACLPAIYKSDCVLFTFRIDLSDYSVSFVDVKVYDYQDTNWVGEYMNPSYFGKCYQLLTNSDKYLGNVSIDLAQEEVAVQDKQELKGLSIDNLVTQLESLGYKRKTRSMIPDYVFMNINHSAWLNEREFVTLREYKGSGKTTYQLDMYQNGRYHSSLTGDFNADFLEVLSSYNKSGSGGSTIKELPVVLANEYKNNRNGIGYDTNDLFINFSEKYSTLRSGTYLRVGKGYYHAARLDATKEYCICYTIKGNSSNMSYILVRFKQEQEMFNAYKEIFKGNSNKEGIYDVALLSYMTDTNYALTNLYEKLMSLGKNSDSLCVGARVVLKHLGFSDKDWKDIFYMVSDEVFETMIFS